MNITHWLATLLQDLRYGLRQLRLNPGFTVVAVSSLALGIGANTAVFQLLDAVRLRTLPVAAPQELVSIDFPQGSMRSGWHSNRSARLTFAQWEQIQAQQQGFTGVLAWAPDRFNLALGGEVRFAEGLYVSGDFFRVLGVAPILGRTFRAEDDRVGCGSPGAVIGYAFWQREFAGDPHVLGRTVILNGRPIPVVGVTAPAFFGVEPGYRYDVALPLCADDLFINDPQGLGRIKQRQAWWLSAMGRLKPGWTAERASAQLGVVSSGIMQATLPPQYRPDDAKRYLQNRLEATAGGAGVSQIRQIYEKPLWLLLATTGLVLVIACANLANLLLARASVREREIAIRQAIGASRGKLVGQLMAENLLLAATGAVLGALLAQLVSRLLVAFLSTPQNPVFLGLGLDMRVLAFTAAAAVGTCLLFGLLPALRGTHVPPADAMRGGGRGVTSGRNRFTLRRALVVAQVSLSLVLLAGALLFAGSFEKLLHVDLGFRPDGVISVSMDFGRQYAKDRIHVVSRELLDSFRSLPGVVSAAQVWFTPVSGNGWDERAWADSAAGSRPEANFDRTGPGYFRTMGIALLAGREFEDRDGPAAPKVAIVNEAFTKTIFGGGNPVGRAFRTEGEAGKPDRLFQVVGLVRNTKYSEIREDFKPVAYFPIAQEDDPYPGATYVLRTSGTQAEALRHVKAAAAQISPTIGLEFRVLRQQLDDSLQRDRLMASLAGGFGLLAVVLATTGLYGVIAYMVERRRNEIGIRIALGAGRGRVVRLVMQEVVFLLAVGLLIGAALALWLGRAAGALLFGFTPSDPVMLASAMGLLVVVALLAGYGPAWRAARLEPMLALREE
ncbi:MAG: ABC transporter permease [Acidobacteriia bacterium]|nr:ABC transporter permease [Terriglobia bacterium]